MPESGEFRPVTAMFINIYAFSRFLEHLELWTSVGHDTSMVGQVLQVYYTHAGAHPSVRR